ITYTITATVSPTATGTVSTTATVGGRNVSSLSATDSDKIPAAKADLSITTTDDWGGSSVTGTPGTVVPGTAITYTITVRNTGLGAADGASIVDTLPSTLTGATYTAVGTGGASGFAASGSGNIDDSDVDLPTGSTITYTVEATIASSATGTLSNTATLTAQNAVGESGADSGSATDTDTLTPEWSPSVTITDNQHGSSVSGATGTAVPGNTITYTIVVSNSGPSDLAGASIVDVFSNLLTGATYTAVGTGGASGFTASGSGDLDDSDVNLPAGSAVTYTVTATISSSATGTLSNTVTVSPPQAIGVVADVVRSDAALRAADAATSDSGSTSATDIDTLTPESNLVVTKIDNLGGSSVTGAIGTAAPGQTITYTIVVTNTGPSDATDAAVVDDLPDTLSGASFTAMGTSGVTGLVTSGVGSIRNTGLDIPAGGSVTYTVHATIVSTANGKLSSTTTATAFSGAGNSLTTSCTATDVDTVSSSSSPLNLGAIDFTVSALLTGNLSVTGSYGAPPVPRTGLPLSQNGSLGLAMFPLTGNPSLPTAAVDNVLGFGGGGGGDVELVNPQFNLDLSNINPLPNPLANILSGSRREDWSSDELIGSLLEKLADVDELSLVSFEFGDDVVTPTPGKPQRVTAAKPVFQQVSTGAPTNALRGGSNAPTSSGQPTGGQDDSQQQQGGGTMRSPRSKKGAAAPTSTNGTVTGNGGNTGNGSGGSTAPAADVAAIDLSDAGEASNHRWFPWLAGGIATSSAGSLLWAYRRRRTRGFSVRWLRWH
ncbi:MAG TPA: hypothetical protein VMF30_00930, partial [Pirellulales bacterium]|nr:hypothetical protein [Pirellulales bacterium]